MDFPREIIDDQLLKQRFDVHLQRCINNTNNTKCT